MTQESAKVTTYRPHDSITFADLRFWLIIPALMALVPCNATAQAFPQRGSPGASRRGPTPSQSGPAVSRQQQQQIEQMLRIELPDNPATVMAYVGETPILLGELTPRIDAKIKSIVESGRPIPPDQLKLIRVSGVRQLLLQSIQQKMMRDAYILDQVSTQAADQRDEAFAKMTAKGRQYFFEEQLPKMKEKYEIEDLQELDRVLEAQGSSLRSERRAFIDAMLSQIYVESKVDREPRIPISDIFQHYQENKQDYYREAEARWEQLTVRFDRFGSRGEAMAAINAMGREAFFGGSMQAVARAKSQEPFASDGGVHDWTPQGTLRSDKLDHNIFALPLNKMSNVIADDDGLHIIRVLDRRPAGYQPLSEVQDDIERKLQADIVQEQRLGLIEEMAEKVPVWSWFPDDIPGAQPLPNSPPMLR